MSLDNNVRCTGACPMIIPTEGIQQILKTQHREESREYQGIFLPYQEGIKGEARSRSLRGPSKEKCPMYQE